MPTADRVKPVQPAYISKPAVASAHMPNFIGHDDVQHRAAIWVANICQFFNDSWGEIQPACSENQWCNGQSCQQIMFGGISRLSESIMGWQITLGGAEVGETVA